MHGLRVFLLLLAIVLFAVGAFVNPPRVVLGWLGAACFALAVGLPWIT